MTIPFNTPVFEEEELVFIREALSRRFHETKNVISGEGGALIVNRAEARDRAEWIWEKGTNRVAPI